MRRLLTILILCLSFSVAFSENIGTFDFSAYYQLSEAGEEYLKIEIFEPVSSDVVGYNGYSDVNGQSVNTAVEVFTWRLSSNTENKVTLVFAFSPLQANVDSMYYIPRHDIDLYMTNYVFDSLLSSEYNLRLSVDWAHHNIQFKEKASGDRPYPGNYYGGFWKGQEYEYNGQSPKTSVIQYQYTDYGSDSNWRTIDSSVTDLYRSDWAIEGNCKYTIWDMDSIGDVDYISNVTVDVSVE